MIVSFSHLYREKKLSDIKSYLDNIIIEKIISKLSTCEPDITTNMQFNKMQNKINGSLATIQYPTKCINPLYPKFRSKIFSVNFFRNNFYLVIAYAVIQTTASVHIHLSVIAPYDVTISSTKMHRYGIPQPI